LFQLYPTTPSVEVFSRDEALSNAWQFTSPAPKRQRVETGGDALMEADDGLDEEADGGLDEDADHRLDEETVDRRCVHVEEADRAARAEAD
jgi:hypothetical protein